MNNKQTYSEYIGAKPIDWNAFLDKPTYSLEELQNACSKSNDWVTCACGNQCAMEHHWITS